MSQAHKWSIMHKTAKHIPLPVQRCIMCKSEKVAYMYSFLSGRLVVVNGLLGYLFK
jgi:hypothetical protein